MGFVVRFWVDFISKKQHIQKNLWNLWPEAVRGTTTFHSYQSRGASRLKGDVLLLLLLRHKYTN